MRVTNRPSISDGVASLVVATVTRGFFTCCASFGFLFIPVDIAVTTVVIAVVADAGVHLLGRALPQIPIELGKSATWCLFGLWTWMFVTYVLIDPNQVGSVAFGVNWFETSRRAFNAASRQANLASHQIGSWFSTSILGMLGFQALYSILAVKVLPQVPKSNASPLLYKFTRVIALMGFLAVAFTTFAVHGTVTSETAGRWGWRFDGGMRPFLVYAAICGGALSVLEMLRICDRQRRALKLDS